MNLKPLQFFIAILLAVSIASCKKTIELPAQPQNKITEYKVVNLTDTVIYGAIDQVEKSITVYVPFYYSLAVIDPQISVSDGAAIVEKVIPVSVDAQNVTYTVKAKDGSTNTYKLKIIQQNIPSLTVRWAFNQNVEASPPLALPPILGSFESRNGAEVQVDLTNQKTGKTVTYPKGSPLTLMPSDNDYVLNNILLPSDIDTGYYKVKVTFQGHSAQITEPVHVVYQQPNLLIPVREAKQGGTISFTAFNSVFVGLKSASVKVNGVIYSLAIQSSTFTDMTLKIPDNFPVGVYYYTANYSFEFEGWPTVNRTGALTVTAK
ncbi:hypothetical protein SAMN05421821_101136 [Mucilaginibacter lappiensis]|uniref:DUF5018 domain-containing protein n=1 Tax=Mucilaginibacter lappiensis TaxID=354630 RepID=A0ABR6PDX9_9SPHI|nr:hypothetical protein [Mucilaginibacter lappiensis]MBB6107949.1 hypothetical protein [Mucilaginibacter lappiensis]SIP91494.1 hypothetical protein SAMN05421821_101136 [Mucilaginibacter lappiensis]